MPKLQICSAYQPRSVEQTEVINRGVGEMFEIFMSNMLTQWSLINNSVEFGFDNLFVLSHSKLHVKLVYVLYVLHFLDMLAIPRIGRQSTTTVDLVG